MPAMQQRLILPRLGPVACCSPVRPTRVEQVRAFQVAARIDTTAWAIWPTHEPASRMGHREDDGPGDRRDPEASVVMVQLSRPHQGARCGARPAVLKGDA